MVERDSRSFKLQTCCSGNNNGGSFSSRRFLELESSGQRSEVRLHYRTRGQQAHTEVFPYSLADGQWHKVSVAVSASHVILHVDCNR